MRTMLAMLAAGVLCVSQALADRPVRQARSENGMYRLRIKPGRPQRQDAPCHATLLARGRGGTREVWSKPLVNEIAPTHAFIHDDGRFVVTLDEYRRGGAVHAVVIYDATGEPLREFDLAELLPPGDMRHVERSRGPAGEALDWLDDAECGFDPALPQFVIQLAWDREIRIDLERFTIAAGATTQPIAGDRRGRRTARSNRPEDEPQAIAAFGDGLGDPNDPNDPNAAQIFSQMQGGSLLERIPLLARLFGALPPAPPDEFADASGERAAEDLEALLSQAALEAVVMRAMLAAADQSLAEQDADFVVQAQVRMALQQAIADAVARAGAGVSAQVGVPVPMPNPAAPVDYVDWLNQMTRLDGETAEPLIKAASDLAVRANFDDAELLQRALDGDPLALSDPAIQDWIDANGEALALFRLATQLPFNGHQVSSEDGRMISVLLPWLGNSRELTRVSVVVGRQAEARGDYDAAVDSYATALAFGGQTGRGATLIESLAGLAMERMAGDALLDMYARAPAGGVDYSLVAERVDASFRPRRSMAENAQFERAMNMDILQRLYAPNPDTGDLTIAPDALRELAELTSFAGEGDDLGSALDRVTLGLRLAQYDFDALVGEMNDFYDRATSALQSDYPTGAALLEASEADLAANRHTASPLLPILAPSFSRTFTLETRGEANRRALSAVTHLQAYRQQHGHYPDSLESLGIGQRAIDPFTGEPFVYQVNGDDFVLYSRGEDGVDDGGTHDPQDPRDLRYWPRP